VHVTGPDLLSLKRLHIYLAKNEGMELPYLAFCQVAASSSKIGSKGHGGVGVRSLFFGFHVSTTEFKCKMSEMISFPLQSMKNLRERVQAIVLGYCYSSITIHALTLNLCQKLHQSLGFSIYIILNESTFYMMRLFHVIVEGTKLGT
jgi:hypothetical protein